MRQRIWDFTHGPYLLLYLLRAIGNLAFYLTGLSEKLNIKLLINCKVLYLCGVVLTFLYELLKNTAILLNFLKV